MILPQSWTVSVLACLVCREAVFCRRDAVRDHRLPPRKSCVHFFLISVESSDLLLSAKVHGLSVLCRWIYAPGPTEYSDHSQSCVPAWNLNCMRCVLPKMLWEDLICHSQRKDSLLMEEMPLVHATGWLFVGDQAGPRISLHPLNVRYLEMYHFPIPPAHYDFHVTCRGWDGQGPEFDSQSLTDLCRHSPVYCWVWHQGSEEGRSGFKHLFCYLTAEGT